MTIPPTTGNIAPCQEDMKNACMRTNRTMEVVSATSGPASRSQVRATPRNTSSSEATCTPVRPRAAHRGRTLREVRWWRIQPPRERPSQERRLCPWSAGSAAVRDLRADPGGAGAPTGPSAPRSPRPTTPRIRAPSSAPRTPAPAARRFAESAARRSPAPAAPAVRRAGRVRARVPRARLSSISARHSSDPSASSPTPSRTPSARRSGRARPLTSMPGPMPVTASSAATTRT